MNTTLQQRIKEAAKRYADKAVHYIDDSEEDMIKVMVDFTEQMLSNQWISVGESLPQKDDLYFVLINNTHPRVTEFENGKWQGYDNITHWMSIPELKGGE